MKAVTLHQPWASLVALGVKTIETRSWPCPPSLIGQLLAIHAGAKLPPIVTFVGDFHVAQGATWLHGRDIDVPLPLGAVVATCRVAACAPIGGPHSFRTGYVQGDEGDFPGQPVVVLTPPIGPGGKPYLALDTADRRHVDISDQLPYGDFRPGRYAWLLEGVKPTTERCPACWGHQGRHADICSAAGVNQPCHICGDGAPCPACDGAGHCPPVPARGRQRVWNWEA